MATSYVQKMPTKDPASVEPYFIVWCSRNGTNDGSATDTGELQGATISTSTWSVPSGITKDSDNKNGVSIGAVDYAVNTVTTIWLSGGTAGTVYTLTNTITTSDGRTLVKSIAVPVNTL